MNEKHTILSAINAASEKLEGSKLDDTVLKDVKEELCMIAEYDNIYLAESKVVFCEYAKNWRTFLIQSGDSTRSCPSFPFALKYPLCNFTSLGMGRLFGTRRENCRGART